MSGKLAKLPTALRVLWWHRQSGLFDYEWYLQQNPDVRAAAKRPFMHFALYGVFEGRPPHARFNAHSYLAANPDVKAAGQPPLLHYVLHGHAEKRPLVVPPDPNKQRLQLQNKKLAEENELLLLQLHQVQEELEHYFLENRKLKDSREQLADLRKQHQDLEARQSALAAEKEQVAGDLGRTVQDCEELRAKLNELEKSASDAQERHSLLLNSFKEAEAKFSAMSTEREALAKGHEHTKAELAAAVAARDNALKERDQARTEREALAKERDTLKTTVTERAMRIAELEAQVADQAERQKKIDEEMAKAEGQLDMLKDLLRPVLS
jgi:DNA repair exonuclease SbcCD ATPase subunit